MAPLAGRTPLGMASPGARGQGTSCPCHSSVLWEGCCQGPLERGLGTAAQPAFQQNLGTARRREGGDSRVPALLELTCLLGKRDLEQVR